MTEVEESEMVDAEMVNVFKALSNPVRLQVLQWLRDPNDSFGAYEPIMADRVEVGVCVWHIQQKTGLAQSTVSTYMAMLERAGLVSSTWVGKWKHYRRNEAVIERLVGDLARDL